MTDIILYAAIATIVCAMLYSVLGKQVGRGPDKGFDPEQLFKAEDGKGEKLVIDPNPSSQLPGMDAIMRADPEFSLKHFIDGAKSAYVLILEAFAAGDKEQLEQLLKESVYNIYAAAITDREKRKLTQVTDLGRLKSARFIEGKIDKKVMYISVLFDAELSSALIDADGQTVEGDPDILAEISEVWTFEKSIKSNDPNWLLSSVSASTGDVLESDPTPDTQS